MLQVIPQTKEEKTEMYMKFSKKELVSMLIAANDALQSRPIKVEQITPSIEWVKCPHGIELRSDNLCDKCAVQKHTFTSLANSFTAKQSTRIPIRRGCKSTGQCFCTGSCQQIIGYRNPLPGENM